MKFLRSLLIILAGLAAVPTQAATTLTDTWTLVGGGLDPATYGGNYMPATLVSDPSSTGHATITGLSAFTSGGLGSSGFPNGYGGIYTFFTAPVTLTVQTSTVLDDVGTITFSFLAGGGFPTAYAPTQSSLTLNFNSENTSVVASSFAVGADPVVVSTPIGDQSLSLYTWTWNVGSLGGSDGFSFVISTGASNAHTWFQDITLTQSIQAVPEPSTFALIALGAGAYLLRRQRKQA